MQENIFETNADAIRKQNARDSYRAAVNRYRNLPRFRRISWVTWSITFATIATWFFTAYQVALAAGARNTYGILMNVLSGAQDADVLIRYGAKDNDLIKMGQYWRFITPIFLHANILHVGLNMLNFLILGVFIERLFGHTRFLLVYLITGVISVIASFYFAPDEISVGASGAIFGLVGAYSIFVLLHRRAFPRGGIPALIWLVFVIGINLSIGFFVPEVDNYAHIGGLFSGCLLGWLFTPRYILLPGEGNMKLVDVHSLVRRWPLALLTILGTLLLALLALNLIGG